MPPGVPFRVRTDYWFDPVWKVVSDGVGRMSSGKIKKVRERRVRFVPGAGSFVFAQARPFHAILKDTGDPRIKKLHIESPLDSGNALQIGLPPALLERLKAEATRHQRTVTSQIESILHDYFQGGTGSSAGTANVAGARENPLDRVFLNIMEAADLTLDEAGPDLQRRILNVIRHSFQSLVLLRNEGNLRSDEAQERLKAVLADLQTLRDIADQEIAAQKRPQI